MQFSEKQLVDLWWDEGKMWDQAMMPRKRKGIKASREYELPSGKRCDVLIYGKSKRIFTVIEFKIEADPSAIIQAYNYACELYSIGDYERDFRAGFVCVAAQFFKKETLFFAEQMGVQCIQIAPINYHSSRSSIVIHGDRKVQHDKRWDMRSDG